MKRWLTVAVVAGCGSKGAVKDAAPPPTPVAVKEVDAAAAPAGVVTGRTCTPAHFVAIEGGGRIPIHEIAADCTSRVVQTLELEDEWVFEAAWPRRDQPLALAVGEREAGAASHVLVFDAPLTPAALTTPPRKVVPPGTGSTEPEGHEFSLVSDGKGVFVERCTAWDDGGGGGEESEEWSCVRHVYFALDDKAGTRAKAVKPEPRDAFEPLFTGGTVPGTEITLKPMRKHLECTAGGRKTKLDPWGVAYGGAVTPLSIVPLSKDEYLLGYDQPGSRMSASRSVQHQRMRGCEEGADVGGVIPGPAPYWAELVQDQGWRIHLAGETADVLDAAGQPARFEIQSLAWTQP